LGVVVHPLAVLPHDWPARMQPGWTFPGARTWRWRTFPGAAAR